VAAVIEDTVQSGNVFANDIDLDAGDADNDGIADGLTVTAVDGDAGAVGQTVTVGAAGSGVSAVINADGSYTVDANAADWLAEGESFSDTISYAVDDGNGGSDTATLTINVFGVNDEEAITGGDAAGAVAELADGDPQENIAVLSDAGTLDFIDVDLSDAHVVSFAAQSGDYLGAFTAELGADTTGSGTGGVINWSFSVSDAALDGLGAGEQLIQYYDVSVDDGYGNVSTETVAITLTGAADGQGPRDWEDEDHFGTFLNKKGVAQGISNVVLYLQDGEDITKVKIDSWDGSVKDLDDVDLGNFLDTYFADSELIAVSIKAGNNHNADLGPGEGQLFLLDGDDDIDYLAGGPAPAPLTHDDLAAKADYTFDYNAGLFF
jgi:VCBS repeat-containing protein